MLAGAEIVAFVPTCRPERSQRFYRDTLGLALIEQTQFASVYRTANAELRVTAVPTAAGATYTVLGWRVPDIVAAATWLREREVELLRYEGLQQDEIGVWQSPGGARVVWFSDPDGNVLSLTQS